MFDDIIEPITPQPTARYVCAQCGRPGIVDEFTRVDARYATGRCSGDHKGQQYLVREDVLTTEKKRRKR